MKEFTFKVNKNATTIKQYLTTIEKFVTVHPLIYKMTDLGDNKYKVFEKITIGIIPIHFSYNASITQCNDSVIIEAMVMGLAKITMLFTFKEINNFTFINEMITVNSKLPIKNYMLKLIKQQHLIMFNTIELA